MRYLLIYLLFLSGCVSVGIPPEYRRIDMKTQSFTIATWQKITNPSAPYRVYIEGDGHAFNAHGHPSQDPTPKGTLVRELAFSDKNDNVIYLSRPCQYVKNELCQQKYWTSARFAPDVIDAEYQALEQVTQHKPTILIGFSGGAQVAGLLAVTKPELNVKKIITIAGNLDHRAWVGFHNLAPLNESLNLADYYTDFIKIPQIHYVGEDDKVIFPHLVQQFIKNNASVILVPHATHDKGWERIYKKIQSEN